MRAAVVLLCLVTACASESGVTRIFDDRTVVGSYVEPEAYAAFLRGSIAQSEGRLEEARLDYLEAAKYDDDDREIWTRIAEVTCQRHPGDRRACAQARGSGGEFANVQGRDQMISRTLAYEGDQAAWASLATWAHGHGDAWLTVLAFSRFLSLAPSEHPIVANAVRELAGEGEIAAARFLAGALVDTEGWSVEGHSIGHTWDPLVARLSVDDSLIAGDIERARARATSVHVSLAEIAGRALLLDRPDLARELVEVLKMADPREAAARMVDVVVSERAGGPLAMRSAFGAGLAGNAPVPPSVLLPYLKLITIVVSAEQAHAIAMTAWLAPIAAGDALLTRMSVELASRDVLPVAQLPDDAKLELAIRRGEGVPPKLSHLDARHQFLAEAWAHPESSEAVAWESRLSRVCSRDYLIAFAASRVRRAHGEPVDLRGLLAMAPAEPLVLAQVLEMGKVGEDDALLAQARKAAFAIGTMKAP